MCGPHDKGIVAIVSCIELVSRGMIDPLRAENEYSRTSPSHYQQPAHLVTFMATLLQGYFHVTKASSIGLHAHLVHKLYCLGPKACKAAVGKSLVEQG